MLVREGFKLGAIIIAQVSRWHMEEGGFLGVQCSGG